MPTVMPSIMPTIFTHSLLLLSLTNVITAIETSEISPPPDQRPNILFLMADDMGWACTSAFGGTKISTPHIDRLAAGGVMVDNFYSSSPVCTPTRISVLTGRYPLRFDVTNIFRGAKTTLPADVPTSARFLQAAGYQTAHLGKWHLGGLYFEMGEARLRGENEVPGPLQFGFDHYLTAVEDANHPDGSIRIRLVKERLKLTEGGKYLIRNDQRAPAIDRHWTDIRTDEAIARMDAAKQAGKPFFINLWWDVPHLPFEPAPEPHLSQYQKRGAKGNDLAYRSMVSHMDANIGRLIDHLKNIGQLQHTLIVFTADNGPHKRGNTAEPFRGFKRDLLEGGIRVPTIFYWPGQIPAGGRNTQVVGSSIDFLPIFAAAAGVDLPENLAIDGINLLPNLQHNMIPMQERTLFWYCTHSPSSKAGKLPSQPLAVRRGQWKLLANTTKASLAPAALFDLTADIAETNNVLDEHPEIAADLLQALQHHLDEPRQPLNNSRSKK